MKTTEIFVEQVLIGFLVLLTGGLMFYEPILCSVGRLPDKTLVQAAIGATLVGAAYLIGIVYDRFADTLLEDIEQHFRLDYAAKRSTNLEKEGDDDPFPENKFRIWLLENEAATDNGDYLRSRIRLARATATLIPGGSVSLLLGLLKADMMGMSYWRWAALSIPLTYAIAFVIKVRKRKPGSLSMWSYKPPKTYDRAAFEEYLVQKGYLRRPGHRKRAAWFLARELLWIPLAILTAVGFSLAIAGKRGWLVTVPLTGIVLTVVTGWSWRRICKTYYQFLDDFQKYWFVRGIGSPPKQEAG